MADSGCARAVETVGPSALRKAVPVPKRGLPFLYSGIIFLFLFMKRNYFLKIIENIS
ncbi:hypothetical protein HMPREF9413_0797 [Paenibacillus sp. HGF7]|nr:hypothetical protein HMPREF9413_0797 [Paenibacillus sp. HGF7]